MEVAVATVAKNISCVTKAGYFTNSFIIELVKAVIIKLMDFQRNQHQLIQIIIAMVDLYLALFIIIKHS